MAITEVTNMERITVNLNAVTKCISSFYTAFSGTDKLKQYEFEKGINILYGGIDTDAWAISYIISMNGTSACAKNTVYYDEPTVFIDGDKSSLEELAKISCYIDKSNTSLFSKQTVRRRIENALKKTRMDYTPEDVKELFGLDDQRFERPVIYCGNEALRAMCAISFCEGKKVFCFPWFSKKLYKYSEYNLNYTVELLKNLGCFVILPLDESIILHNHQKINE